LRSMEYRSTIKSMPFFFLETKKASNLILQGLSETEIKEKAIQENIFQVNSEARKKEIASTILKRLKELDEFLLRQLAQGNVELGKLIVVYAIMKNDRLFFEFMNEVFKEKIIIKEERIEEKDFNIFFERKKEQSDKVASWSDYCFYKIKQVYIRILFESGLIKDQKRREIVKPLLNQSVISHWEAIGEKVVVNIFLGLN
jgi:hypothetical protein